MWHISERALKTDQSFGNGMQTPPPSDIRFHGSVYPEPQWMSHVYISLDGANTWTQINILSKFLDFSPTISWDLRRKKDYNEFRLGSAGQIFVF